VDPPAILTGAVERRATPEAAVKSERVLVQVRPCSILFCAADRGITSAPITEVNRISMKYYLEFHAVDGWQHNRGLLSTA